MRSIPGSANRQKLSVLIIKKLYKACRITENEMPMNKRITFFLFFENQRAMKKPRMPEESACKKVAPIKRKEAIRMVSKIWSCSEKNKKTFSKAAKPKAAIII